MQFHILSFEGPDVYARAGGIASRITGLSEALAEAGIHTCENLRALIADYMAAQGRRPRLWFVEDRLDTLQHVTTYADLADVALFLAAWDYNTPEMRASVRGDGRIRLLELDQFRGGLTTWC